MIMKNIAFIVLSITLSINLFAQDENIGLKSNRPEGKGWYVIGQVGYGVPFLTSNMRSPFAEVGDKIFYQNGTHKSIKPQYSTNGNGFNAAFAFGHMFNNHIGIETQFMMVNHPEATDAEVKSDNYEAYQKTQTYAMYLSPTLLFHHQIKKFGITTKIGPFIPIGGIVTSRARIIDREGQLIFSLLNYPIKDIPPGILTSVFEGIAKTKLVPTIGFRGALALEYKFNQKITMFIEASASVYNIKIKETIFEQQKLQASVSLFGQNIEITNLGIDKIPEYLKHYVWVDEITETSNNLKYHYRPFDPNKPMEDLTLKLNASSVYIDLGLKVNINRWDDIRGPKKTQKIENKAAKKSAKKG